ncbi:unnamed protein product, partial [Linum tenue]
KRKKRSHLETSVVAGHGGDGTSSSGDATIDPFTKLPDELAVEILSRLGTMNQVAKCSSLVCRRWRNLWRSIDGGVLDFSSYDDDHDRRPLRKGAYTEPEQQLRFANRVDQAVSSILLHHCCKNLDLDAFIIGFDLYELEEEAWRWVEFGLGKRVKQLSLLNFFSWHLRNWVSLPQLTPEFLGKQDLSRLQVLELEGVSKIPRGALDHIFSNCSSLQRLVLRDCRFLCPEGELVIRVCCPGNNLQSLTLEYGETLYNVTKIELVSAPGLQSFRFVGRINPKVVEFVGELPQLREARFGGRGICGPPHYLPWSRSQFSKFAPQLERLEIDLGICHFIPHLAPPPEWLMFENLTVLDLFIYSELFSPKSFLDATVLLRAAPLLHRLSIWFIRVARPLGQWKWRDLAAVSTWKHHSLEVLHLHGVHPGEDSHVVGGSARKIQLELAAYIIMNAPSLNRVLIDTRPHQQKDEGESRLPHQVDADVSGARMELETHLQSHSASPHIHFTYQ